MTAALQSFPPEPAWLEAIRAQAADRFARLPEPEFRYGLDIRMEPVQLSALPAPIAEMREAPRAPAGVLLMDLQSALQEQDALLKDHFLTLLPALDKFTAWHATHARTGWLLHIPAHARIIEPILLPHSSAAAVTAEHCVIIAGEGSSATVVQSISAPDQPGPLGTRDASGHASAQLQYRSLATEVFLQSAAQLTVASVQTLPLQNMFSAIFQRAHLAADASLDWTTGDLGGGATLADMAVTLAGRGSSLRTHQALFGSGSQAFNTNLTVTHAAPDTRCELQSRGALADKAKAIYRGLIKMRSSAARANGNQRADVLLLSPDAEADPVPALEIDTNDVRCSHGTTVGRIDPEKLFYLRSRGLSESEAKQLLVRGFFSPLLHNLGPCRSQLAELLEQKIRSIA